MVQWGVRFMSFKVTSSVMGFRSRYSSQRRRNGQKLGRHSQNASDGEPLSFIVLLS